ncbi:MAG: ferredoxin--NADP reductase [Halomonas sp.]|nr:ferredoxin--NADP reductase [Halomonas sp.]
MAASRFQSLRVSRVIDETRDARSLIFEVPASLEAAFRYRPGQFLTLRLPVGGRTLLRCYSMSSAPGLDDAPRVTVKRVVDGRASNWICDRVRAGDTLEVMAPAGLFVPDSLDDDLLLCAGGSGITPVLSILRSVLHQGRGRVRLIYANRDERSVIFARELDALLRAFPERLQVIHWLDSLQGVPSVPQLAWLARAWVNGEAFICGPGPFMDAMLTALDVAGMPAERVHVERFQSLPDEDEVATATPEGSLAPTVEQAQIAVEIGGEVHEFACGGEETLLEAAERAGLELPYSCQAGMCASCVCQVVEGEVALRHNDVLDQRDLDRRMTLGCQAVPTSERLRVRYL